MWNNGEVSTSIERPNKNSTNLAVNISEDLYGEGESGDQFPGIIVPAHPKVNEFVNEISKHDKRYFRDALNRRNKLTSTLESIFAKHGLPRELINVAYVESSFKPDAIGYGGRGLWQLSEATARKYGLVVSKDRDERFSVEKSTEAAARHLKDLYNMYGDWYLVLAAYNSGHNRIQQAIKQTGTNNFFDLADSNAISKTTQKFIPKFLAYTLLMRDHQEKEQ